MTFEDKNEMAMEDGKNNGVMDGVKFTKAVDGVDVSMPTTKLIGLTKEELEKYRNDPFWKAVRYGLFILFWVVWAAMFVGAILIVVLSPKCAAKVEPKWHENAVAYQIFTPTFRDTDGDGMGDFKGIQEKLNDLRKVGVTTIWPTPVLSTEKNVFAPEEVVEITTTDKRFGTEDDLKSLIEATHKGEMKFVIDLPLTVSVTGENWLSKEGLPNSTTQSSSPRASLLDLTNVEVQNKLLEAAKKWLQMGVDGFFLTDYGLTARTARTPARTPGAPVRTTRAAGEAEAELIKRLRAIAKDDDLIAQKDVLIFTSNDQAGEYYTQSLAEPASAGGSLLDRVGANIQKGLGAIQHNATKPIWQLASLSAGPRIDQILQQSSNPQDNGLKAHSRQTSSLLTLIQLFLPGPVSILYGEELALPSGVSPANGAKKPQYLVYQQWEPSNKSMGFTSLNVEPKDLFFLPSGNNPEGQTFKEQQSNPGSQLKAFEKLAELRVRDPVFQHGDTFSKRSNDGLEFYGRAFVGKPSETAYLLALNWGNDPKPLPKLSELAMALGGKNPTGKAEVKVSSAGLAIRSGTEIDLSKESLVLAPFTAAVLRVF